MISFHYETAFRLEEEHVYKDWVAGIIKSEGKIAGELAFVLTSDTTLLEMNQKYLNHDYYTDILTFDYSEGKRISGDVFVSMDRIMENAAAFDATPIGELKRVMAHGVLHLLGYGDGDEAEKLIMRNKEDEKIRMFHVEQ